MIVAERSLRYRTATVDQEVSVRIFAPENQAGGWICRYEIDWPVEPRSSFGAGLDAVQALHLTLQKIGLDLYTSAYHASGGLFWGETGAGYGFPVPKHGRDLLVGDDLTFEG